MHKPVYFNRKPVTDIHTYKINLRPEEVVQVYGICIRTLHLPVISVTRYTHTHQVISFTRYTHTHQVPHAGARGKIEMAKLEALARRRRAHR